MTNEKKQAVKSVLKKIGKVVWSTLPWVCLTIWFACVFSLLFTHADDCAERSKQLSALEAENAMYESENARLDEEVDWLRSLVERVGSEEDGDGQIQQ